MKAPPVRASTGSSRAPIDSSRRPIDSSRGPVDSSETENDRFKRSFEYWLWGSMIVATILHFMLFQLWPTQTVEGAFLPPEELEIIELLPAIEIPPPPEPISRPATPVIAVLQIDDDVAIAPITVDDSPTEVPPPPPPDEVELDVSANPVFTPMTVQPEIMNRAEVRAALVREYPALLRSAGVGGRVVVWFFLSEEGTVLDRRISQSSGLVPLDEAALRVADVFRFSPALDRDRVVQVWIQMPITFQIGSRAP